MPLSPAAARNQAHRREIECLGYRREDGMWDIEGHLVDTKAYLHHGADGRRIPSGVPVHEMWLRLTVDDDMLVHAAEATTDHGPYSVCPAINARYAQLAGLRIAPGFTRRASAIVGGVNGCTHITALLQVVAATAFQTIFPVLSREQPETAGERALMLNSCHAFADDGEVVREYWPQLLSRPADEPGDKAGGAG